VAPLSYGDAFYAGSILRDELDRYIAVNARWNLPVDSRGQDALQRLLNSWPH
jgi:hypothetical protein